MRAERGFTLLELLTTVGIILVLAAVVYPIATNCIGRGRAATEIAGARRAVAAWVTYAVENNNTILPGYKTDPSAVNVRGQNVGFPANARYVFRLAPYLNYELKGSLFVNDQKKVQDDYEMSMAPSFGINLTFVGGDYGGGSDLYPSEANFSTYGKFVVTNLNEIHSPTKLIVFASARITDGARSQEGYNAIKSPRLRSERWSKNYEEDAPYYEFGAVHPRFDGRAVCAMADGHVELLGANDLRDMRRWSNQAAMTNDPDWNLQPL